MPKSFRVSCDYLCVPDGREANGDLRLSIQVTPMILDGAPANAPPGTDFIPIELWPSTIAGLSEKVVVQFAKGNNANSAFSWSDNIVSEFHGTMKKVHSKFVSEGISRAAKADELWAKSFRFTDDQNGLADFDCLQLALRQAWADTEELNDPTLEIIDRRASDLGSFFEQLAKIDGNGITGAAPALLKLWGIALEKVQNTKLVEGTKLDKQTTLADVHRLFEERESEIDGLSESFAAMLRDGAVVDKASMAPAMALLEHVTSPFHKGAECGPHCQENDDDHICEIGDDGICRHKLGTPICEQDESAWGTAAAEAGKRKLSAILSLPSLAHYLGCGIQITIPKDIVPEGFSEGLIRARLKEDQNTESQWTAFSLKETSEVADRGFVPRAKSGQPGKGEERYLDEHVNFSAKVGQVRRYRMDAIAQYPSLTATLSALSLNPKDLPAAAGAEIKRRGITCYDNFAKQQLFADLFQDKENGIAKITFLDELLRGFRPDIGIAKADQTIESSRWRSLTQRKVVCEDAEMDPEYYTEQGSKVDEYLLERDHGVCFAPVEEPTGTSQGGSPTRASKEPDLFTWGGESLAVTRSADPESPMPNDKEYTRTPVDPLVDLGLNISYSFPDDVQNSEKLPPLREGIGYFVGCRLSYVNGAGPDFADNLYDSAKLRIGTHGDDPSAPDSPFIYPEVEWQAPDVHLAWDDPVIFAETRAGQRGETSLTCVIRDSKGSARRFVTPQRVAFDIAEMQRQFDGVSKGRPRGAFTGGKDAPPALWLASESGALPEARFSGLRYMIDDFAHDIRGREKPIDLKNIPATENSDLAHPLGTVALLINENSTEPPYYLNKNARLLKASLYDEVEEKSLETEIEFWTGDNPEKAAPALLEIGFGADFKMESGTKDIRDSDGGSMVTVPWIGIELKEASRAKLWLSNSDYYCGERIAREVEIIHAQQIPSVLLAHSPLPESGNGLNAVSVTTTDNDPWRAFVKKQVDNDDNKPTEMLGWEGEPAGASTYFVGRIGLNRREVGTLTANAVWKEFSTNTIRQVIEDGKTVWKELPAAQSAQLFEIEVADKPLENSDEDDWVNLLSSENMDPDHVGERKLRGLSYNFPDGRARKLVVTLSATSAFTDFYNLPEADQRKEITVEVETECTFRPPPPVVERAMPLLSWAQSKHAVQRKAGLRIYLGEDWYASGVGEKLGVVLLPADTTISDPCAYFTDELAPFQHFISRPGTDPARVSAGVPFKLTGANFKGADVVSGKLFLADDPTTPGSEQDLCIGADFATYDITVDEREGAFVDIEIDLPGDLSYQPFVHLGLVRYQRQGLTNLKASHPIEYIANLLPERTFTIDLVSYASKTWSAKVEGPSYSIEAQNGNQEAEPAFRAALYGWRPGYHRGADRINSCWEVIKDDYSLQKNDPDNQGLVSWVCDNIRLPFPTHRPGDYEKFMIQLEEYEQFSAEEGEGGIIERLVYSASLNI